MAQTWRFYLVSDAGEVTGTDNLKVALVAKRDGSTLVIEPRAAEATFDGDAQPIEMADENDYLGDDDSTDDDSTDDDDEEGDD